MWARQAVLPSVSPPPSPPRPPCVTSHVDQGASMNKLQELNLWVMQVLLSSMKVVCQRFQQDSEAQYATHHSSSGKHCGSCCIWNHLLTGGLVSAHLPKQRAIALLAKSLLGLHAQAVAVGNPADIKVSTPSHEVMHHTCVVHFASL